MNRRLILSVLCLSSLGAHLWGAETPGTTVASTNATNGPAAASNADLQELRARIAEQQEQIKRLQQAVDEQQKLLERSLANASRAPATTADGTAMVATSNPTSGGPAKLAPAVNVVHPNIAGLPRAQGGETKASPLSVSIGNTTFTPLGFVDATFFARSTNVGSGIGTNFAGIPFNSAAAGHLSETNFTAQNSRIGFRVDSTFMGAKVLGYFEADFLFNNNSAAYQISSNSAGFRMRNVFVDAQKNGLEILGGQDWTFLTPNRKGLSPIPGDIFYTQNMDTNYQAGLIWARQPQFRIIAHPNENVAFGVSIENPQQYLGGGAGASTVTLPNNLNASLTTQFQPGGTNTGVPNWFPDIIFKGAYDGKAGTKVMHIEAAGLVRGFKDYVTLTTAPALQGSHTAIGFGGSVNANLEIIKNVRLIANTFFSDGGGRYIFGIGPDVIVRPDGSISPLHSYSTVDGVEAQVTKNTLLAFYYGGAYVGRNIAFDPTAPGSTLAKPVYVGYGVPTAGVTQNRNVQEFTFDWIQTLWKNPSYGALSLINQYSYVLRDPWSLATVGAPKSAHSNLIYVDLRYTLP
jgi:hypothetical protein